MVRFTHCVVPSQGGQFEVFLHLIDLLWDVVDMLEKDRGTEPSDYNPLTLLALIAYYLAVAYDGIAAHPTNLSGELSSKPQES